MLTSATATFSPMLLNQIYMSFKLELHSVWPPGKEAGERLLTLKQGKLVKPGKSPADFLLTFHTLAAEGRWNEPALKTVFQQGLNNALQYPEA